MCNTQAELKARIKGLEAVISKKDEITELLEVTDMPLSDTNPDCLPSAILKNSGMPILNKDEISLLARFKETTEDDSSYDLSADELKILAQYGALKHKGGGYYSITEIGQWILNLSIKAGDVQAPKECTNSDTWNCKYCDKTKTCEALKDPRNFGEPIAAAPTDTEGK